MEGLPFVFALLLVAFGRDVVASFPPYEYQVCISSSADPTNGCSGHVCESLNQECIDNVNSSTLIIIASPQVELNEVVTLQEYHTIGLQGQPASKINCSDSVPAGLNFVAVENVSITNLTFEKCTFRETKAASIFVQNSTNVTLQNVEVRYSRGRGIAFVDTKGFIKISDSEFEENDGGGVLLYFDTHLGWSSRYDIQSCNFANNVINDSADADTESGGGLYILFKGNAYNNSIRIVRSKFCSNSARWGSGLCLNFEDSAGNNSVTIKQSQFENNSHLQHISSGGGGAKIRFYIFNSKSRHGNNEIKFVNCDFSENKARYGGGVGVYSTQNTKRNVNFINCTWKQNEALYGAAIDIYPIWKGSIRSIDYKRVPITFKNCQFISNKVVPMLNAENSSWSEYITGMGTIFVTDFSVCFKGKHHFMSNNGSAIFIIASVLKFISNSNVTFENNSGLQGGAVALISYSLINVEDNSTLSFLSNSASSYGGAISSDIYVSSSPSCFIVHTGNQNNDSRNVVLFFSGNIAGNDVDNTSNTSDYNYGNAIYATTLLPCYRECKNITSTNSIMTVENVFSCIANFSYSDEDELHHQVSTLGRKHSVNDSKLPLQVIPGKEFSLPIQMMDELGEEVHTTYMCRIEQNENSHIKIDQGYSYISGKRIEIFGRPGDRGRLLLSTRQVAISLEIHMQECPPGFVHSIDDSNWNELETCSCSVNSDKQYKGIVNCNYTDFQAYIQHGYWIGYDGNATEKDLLTGFCFYQFCYNRLSGLKQTHYRLPSRASAPELEYFICGENRKGTVCGKCKSGYSTYYHTQALTCGKNDHCTLGWLFYILSELLPLTIFFIVVMIFRISFTSGATNGFIFFAQMIDSLSITGNGFIYFPNVVWHLTSVHSLIYRNFNFDFFSIDKLSFCLWEGATSLDALAFKYVTVTYALFLVLATVFVMNICNCYRMCPCLRARTVKSSVIHGLSAFLVMCYTQCTRVSFQILTPTSLYSQGPKYTRTVVYPYGDISYFSKDHMKYAIPALLCLITLDIPPILLLIYPAGNRVAAYFKVENSRWFTFIATRVSVAKLKPLLDSFQSCFKDEYRYFAGLYFFYRLSALLTYAVCYSFVKFYTIVEVELIIMFTFHALAQPYEKRWHNIVDTFIFADLAVINALTAYNFSASDSTSEENYIALMSSIQLILICLPLVYMTAYVILYLGLQVKACLVRNRILSESDSEEEELPARLIDPFEDDDDDSPYQGFEEYEL